MKIVIDIPDYDVELIKEYYEGHDIVESTYSYIYHGQPLSEILDKISAEIEEKMSHYDHFENSTTANGLRMAREIVEGYKKEVREC